MKPNFALSLSMEGITLLHRVPEGWEPLGEVRPDTEDLAEGMAALRAQAEALAPSPPLCKLVVPEDQIRFLTVETGTAPAAEARAIAKDELAAATPYELDELAYDVVTGNGIAQVAAVARDTLDEAEDFARAHGFAPLSFVARPDPADYDGEPFFGASAAAAELLGPDTVVVPDEGVMVILPPRAAAPEVAEPDDLASPDESDDDAPLADAIDDTDADAPASAAPADPQGTPPSFSSIRARRDPTEGSAPPLAGVSRDAPGSVAAASIDLGDEPPANLAEPPLTRDTVSPGASAAAATLAVPATDEKVTGGIARLKRPSGKREPTLQAEPPAPAAAPAGKQAREAEAARMTVFGARPTQVVTGPKYLGLLLTLVLILFLMGVAAWASIFMSDEVSDLLRPGDLPQVAGIEDPQRAPLATSTGIEETALPAAGDTPSPDAAASVEAEEAADEALGETGPVAMLEEVDPGLSDTGLPAPILQPGSSAAVDAPAPPPAPDPEAEARYAATGVWTDAPFATPAPPPGTIEDLYVASIDPTVPNLDAVALPVPDSEGRDSRPGSQPNPAPAGTTFDFDENGLVRATPEGAVTPNGVTIFAGLPQRTPPDRPAETLVTPEEEAADASAAMSAKRPRLRPGGLVERNERLKLGGYSRSELATFRPRARPELPSAKREAEAEADAPSASPTETGTDLAIASSKRPNERPGNFASIVSTAQAAAIRPVAVVAPSQAIAPQIPSNASVTKTATVRDAINLSTINLIGVYGQPSSRRALVRMSDGRYRKVKVGDALDGGRVSSISDGQLSYTKGGRSHLLKMPNG
ncbi:hypothetical protein [Pseudooceanicola sp. LIPI14-2-Ac024]|uniref:hypothetical protein n=1 Tax=Pseudooceanicola sp. LIPI14-2-Ac024 TaxID=3344875 RepID=UPI0035D0C758